MTTTPLLATADPVEDAAHTETIRKVSIVVSHGSLEGIYPALIMANGARMEGIEANLFFTFFGMDAITTKKQSRIRVATVGNPAMGIPTLLGALPGMSALATKMMTKKMDALDIPPIAEFIQLCADSGVRLFACKASVDMFGLERADFVDTLEGIITVGDFYGLAAGGQIIFT
jgi:peroxiredoxin family protein